MSPIRKSEDETEIPNKMDIRGVGSITDLADTVIALWRNKRREADLQKNPQDEEAQSRAGALIECQKQRNGEWEGKASVWFEPESKQFLESASGKPRRYVEYLEAVADEVEF